MTSPHRQVAGDSVIAGAVKVLARAHQSVIWARRRQASQLRSGLREFYPPVLAAFDDLTSSDALQVLRLAPTPAAGAALSRTQIAPQLRGPAVIEAAMGASVRASAAVIVEMTAQITALAVEL
ncbi:MAG TPA: IS110 family transposase, partial [Streptosporangiaceae bacterium]|nr:IS110 family transposase [Streptosporangiaceae bacterium]